MKDKFMNTRCKRKNTKEEECNGRLKLLYRLPDLDRTFVCRCEICGETTELI